jgi:6-phosphogluconolactonase (cycloisomerase 2 family)
MSKKISLVIALLGLFALSVLLVNCGSSSNRPSNILYVLTQGTTFVGNNVSSYAIDLNDGNLSLINANASTCPTVASQSDPEPCGLPLNILLDPSGKVAFVLNQGIPSASVAPTIYAYIVDTDGSLGPPTLAATLTTGDLPVGMALDAAGQFLFVIDQGANPTTANCGAPPNVANIACASISVFAAKPGSMSLTAIAGSPFPVNRLPTALSVVAFTPPAGAKPLPCATTTEFLYVTYNTDLVYHDDNTLSAYCVDSSGTPNDLNPNAPYATAANPISVLAVNTNPVGEATGGLFVYVGNQGPSVGAISVFQVCSVVNALCAAENLAQLVSVGAPFSAGQNPVAMLVDPTNNFLYAVSSLSNQIFGFRIGITQGTLTALSPANQPTGSQPVALAMQTSINESGEYLYVSNTNSSNITGFAVDTTTGSMSNPITVISDPGPSGMAAR